MNRKETTEDKIKRYRKEEQCELDEVSNMADENAEIGEAYGASIEINSEYATRFEEALDEKIERKTEQKIKRALKGE